MFFIRLLLCSFISSFIVPVILAVRKLSKSWLPAKWQYHLWYLMLAAFVIPLIPVDLWKVGALFTQTDPAINPVMGSSAVNASLNGSGGAQWLHDFAVSVSRPDFSFLNSLLGIVWTAGLLILAAAAVHAGFQLRQIRKTAIVTDQKCQLLFEQCRNRLNIKKSIFLGKSPLVKSPMTFGLFRTATILPAQLKTECTEKEMEHIFLHELNHVKSKDIFVNHLICAFQMIYWINPIARIGLKRMKLDREIACDASVLQLLDEHGSLDYGHTILDFVDQRVRDSQLVFVNQFGGSKQNIKKRLEKIASFQKVSSKPKVKGILVLGVTAMLIICQIPVVSAMGIDTGSNRYNFTGKNASYENLSSYFRGCDGCIVLYDLKADHFVIYNKDKSTLRVSPDSTIKIYSALLGLERHVITPKNTVMRWNHMIYPYDSWNANQTLSSAMQNSVNWYFQTIDQENGLQALTGFYNKIGYGNCNLSGGVSSYWQESSLLISPVEQVQVLTKFYQNSMNFNTQNVNTIKASIRDSERNGATLSGKTGSSVVNGKAGNGWFIGYVEKNGNVTFFSTNIQGSDDVSGQKAAQITLSILASKKIY
jgi:bla regulator protein BlaR1